MVCPTLESLREGDQKHEEHVKGSKRNERWQALRLRFARQTTCVPGPKLKLRCLKTCSPRLCPRRPAVKRQSLSPSSPRLGGPAFMARLYVFRFRRRPGSRRTPRSVFSSSKWSLPGIPVAKVLNSMGGNITRASAVSGITRTTLCKKLRAYELEI